MEEYYKFLKYQVGESQTFIERCLLGIFRIYLFCNANRVMNKILITFIFIINIALKMSQTETSPIGHYFHTTTTFAMAYS